VPSPPCWRGDPGLAQRRVRHRDISYEVLGIGAIGRSEDRRALGHPRRRDSALEFRTKSAPLPLGVNPRRQDHGALVVGRPRGSCWTLPRETLLRGPSGAAAGWAAALVPRSPANWSRRDSERFTILEELAHLFVGHL